MKARTPGIAGLVLLLAALAQGCSDASKSSGNADNNLRKSVPQGSGSKEARGEKGEAAFVAADQGNADNAPAPPVQRKIIYNATLKVQVADFADAEGKLQDLINESGAILDSSEIKGTRGTSRSGHWKVRVPADSLGSFRKAVVKLGEPDQDSLSSQDVTEEYYDLTERIKSKQVEVDSYRRLYEKTMTIPEMVTVKRELDRSQEELERFKGRQKLLKHLTDLTSVDITLTERGIYTPKESPSFGITLGRTFDGSLDALVALGKFLVLCAVGLAPWLPPLALIIVPSVFLIRRRFRAWKAATTPATVLLAEPTAPSGN
jgi:hypothetical protein